MPRGQSPRGAEALVGESWRVSSLSTLPAASAVPIDLVGCRGLAACPTRPKGRATHSLSELVSAAKIYDAIQSNIPQSIGTWDFDTKSLWIEDFAAHGNRRARDQLYELLERMATSPARHRDGQSAAAPHPRSARRERRLRARRRTPAAPMRAGRFLDQSGAPFSSTVPIWKRRGHCLASRRDAPGSWSVAARSSTRGCSAKRTRASAKARRSPSPRTKSASRCAKRTSS